MSSPASIFQLLQKADIETVSNKVQTEFRQVDRHSLSPTLFQNRSGLRGNIEAKLALRLAQHYSNDVYDNNPKANTFREKQFVNVGSPYDEELVSNIQSKFEQFVTDDEYSFNVEYNGDVYSRQLRSFESGNVPAFDFAEHIPEIGNLITDEITEIIEGYYGAHFSPEYIQLYRNYHIPPEVMAEAEIFSQRWHRDARPVDFIKLFINLSDVTEKDGPFHILPSEETKNFAGRDYDRSIHGVVDGPVDQSDNILKATGDAGSTMLANTNRTLHRAGVPESGHTRDLLVIQFVPDTSPLPEDWLTSPSVEFNRTGRNVF